MTDGKHVVASFADEGQFVVACWTVSGEELWRKDVGEFLSQHGPACTPIIHGDYVIVAKDMKGPSAVFAFDVQTGAEKWKVDREFERTSYATPVVRKRADGREEVICVSDASGIAGLDLKTGEKLWESPDFPMRTVGSPVLTNGQVLCSSGSGGSGKLMQSVRLDQTGSLEPVWELSQRIPYVPTPVYKDGLLFSVLDRGMLACHNADTGEEVFVERVNGKFTGSPIWVEGRLYAIDEDGVVVVLAADETFQELGRVPLGQTSYSTPAVANGRMYLKTMSKLFCLPAK
ncbi:PQQ-binding-like beta-propeller repeat protein [bacterium]|nr:PQQ-binding-like beta-propeller repeat protein [bacterium]